MLLKEIIWIDKFALKLQRKHHVTVVEVEESLLSGAIFRRSRRGMVEGEDVYTSHRHNLSFFKPLKPQCEQRVEFLSVGSIRLV